MRPTTGMTRSFTRESTILPNAAPMMTPTARSTTLPFTANSRNSLANDIRASGGLGRRIFARKGVPGTPPGALPYAAPQNGLQVGTSNPLKCRINLVSRRFSRPPPPEMTAIVLDQVDERRRRLLLVATSAAGAVAAAGVAA